MKAKIPDCSGKDHAYLGHFAKEDNLRAGHNTDSIFDLFKRRDPADNPEFKKSPYQRDKEAKEAEEAKTREKKPEEIPWWKTIYDRMGGKVE